MDKNVMFSIICPAYNSEDFLESSISSITKQTYSNWELIIIDDGSTDRTGKICDNLASNDKRIKVIHQDNQGQSKARLNGVHFVSGDYILFLDSDDQYESNALEIISKHLDNKGLKALVYNASVIQKNKDISLVYKFYTVKSDIPVVDFFLKRRISYFWSICFKRELFNLSSEIVDKFCSLSYSEDLYLIYNIVKNLTSSDYKIIDEKLYKYIFNDGSLTKNQNAKKAMDRFYAFNSVYESIYLENRKAFSQITKEVRDTAGWTYLSAAKRIALEYDYKHYLPLIKQIRSSFLFKHMNKFKKDKYNYVGYILLKIKMYKRFRNYIIKKEGKRE